MPEKKILIIARDPGVNRLIQKVAADHNYSVSSANEMHEIQSKYIVCQPSLVIQDLDFGDMDGVLLLNYLVNIQCKTPIVITGAGDERLLLAIKHIGETKGLSIPAILVKPFDETGISKIFSILERRYPQRVDAAKLAKALEENRFEMYYQPKIDVKTKRLCGLEALIRWKLPNGDMIPPDHFIPVAEESGLIVALTHWVIHRVFAECSKFNNSEPALQFSINLSPKILSDVVFPDEIFKIAQQRNIKPETICFEVTESGVSHQSELILEVLTRLRVMGFSLSIDDFGTGYSSIAELQRLPFNELKVDKRFVLELVDSTSTQTIVRSTIELGHNLGMELVAEGVETKEVMDMLEDLDCDISQGFLVSKPLPMHELENWYAKNIDKDLIWKNPR